MSWQICNSTSGLLALVTDPSQVIVTKCLIIWCQWTGWSLHPTAECRRYRKHAFSPGSRRSPGGGNGNPLLYSCLENLMNGGAWRAAVHSIAESDTAEHTCTWRHMSSCRPSTVRAQMFLQGPLPCLTLCSQHSLLWAWLAALSHPHFMSTAF